MGQFMAESSVLAGLVQLGVNGYPHLPFASAVSQGGKTRIRGRQDLEIHANSITDCRVLDRAPQPIWFPLTLIESTWRRASPRTSQGHQLQLARSRALLGRGVRRAPVHSDPPTAARDTPSFQISSAPAVLNTIVCHGARPHQPATLGFPERRAQCCVAIPSKACKCRLRNRGTQHAAVYSGMYSTAGLTQQPPVFCVLQQPLLPSASVCIFRH